MQKYSYICWIHTDAKNNRRTQEDFNKIFMPLTLFVSVSKRLCGVLLWEGAWDRTELQYFDPYSYGRQRCVFLVLLMLNRRPRAHSAGWWLSLLHLIRNFSGPQTPSGLPRAPSAACGFTYHITVEITVMQFTGHSLLVHQSRSENVLACPISSANFRPRDFLS